MVCSDFVCVAVIPSKPVNLTVISKTSSSMMIQWSIGFPMQSFPPGILQKVEYKSQWDPRDVWHVSKTEVLFVYSTVLMATSLTLFFLFTVS